MKIDKVNLPKMAADVVKISYKELEEKAQKNEEIKRLKEAKLREEGEQLTEDNWCLIINFTLP